MGRQLAAQIDRSRWRGSTLAALQFLALKADDQTRIVRGQTLAMIAEAIGNLSVSRTKVILRTLRNAGAIETLNRGGGNRTNLYRIPTT